MAKDMTTGNEAKLIFLFTLPIMAGNCLQQLYSTVDAIIVGNYINSNALAAVGTCTPLTMLCVALALGLSTGSGIIISQYYGAKKIDELRRTVFTSLILLTALGVLLSLVFLGLTDFLLGYVLDVPDTIMAPARAYFMVYCGGLVFQFVYNIIAAILRALGDSRATLYFLLISSVVNIFLAILFVVEFNWGVAGSAIATIISQCLSAVISAVYMFRRYEILRFKRSEFKFDKEKCVLSLKLGIPTTIQQCVVSLGQIMIQRLVNSFGEDTISAVTASGRIEQYSLIPIFGFNMGLATYTGQNIGANRVDRVISGYRKTEIMGVAICAVIVCLVFVFAGPLIGMFGLDGQAYAIGVNGLTFLAPFFLLFAFYLITGAVLQGSGDVIFAMSITLGSLVVKVIASYLFAYVFMAGSMSIWYGAPIGWVYAAALVIFRYRQGKWKQKGIVRGEAA